MSDPRHDSSFRSFFFVIKVDFIFFCCLQKQTLLELVHVLYVQYLLVDIFLVFKFSNK